MAVLDKVAAASTAATAGTVRLMFLTESRDERRSGSGSQDVFAVSSRTTGAVKRIEAVTRDRTPKMTQAAETSL